MVMQSIEEHYENYIAYLLAGDREACRNIITACLDASLPYTDIYTGLIEKSLYEVGRLWEQDKISVAQEHLASSITEYLLLEIHRRLFTKRPSARKAIIACAENEQHQIGAKIVADRLEIMGWDSAFLGANTPAQAVYEAIERIRPQLVGLSVTLEKNLAAVAAVADHIRTNFPGLRLLVGGQAAYSPAAKNFAELRDLVVPAGAFESSVA